MYFFNATETRYSRVYHIYVFWKVEEQCCSTTPSYKSKSPSQWSYLQITFQLLVDIKKKPIRSRTANYQHKGIKNIKQYLSPQLQP